ncbi:MAG: DUF3108 domain-containing protein [Chthoniobacterales bacterium]|nr:DUF3108 domain-containing protein [Chthoniobacterales bacterium]
MLSRVVIAFGIFAVLSGHASAAAAWEKTISSSARGIFPNPRPMRATYQFGWNEVVAATAEINFSVVNGHLELVGTGQTSGVVRALWKFDVQHRATADPATLRPLLMHQVDALRSKTVTTDLVFSATGVTRIRSDTKTKKPPTPKSFDFPGLLDLHSALLCLRSQPLTDGAVQRIVVYPATNAYLATVTVAKHESVKVGAGTYKAIKLDLQLSKVNKQRELEQHKKFSQASVWISDDADRLLLRIEARVFIGTVFAELQSVQFASEKH